MRHAGFTTVLLLATFAYGCEKTTPAGPGPTAITNPTTARLVINGVDAILTGSSSSYTVTATLSDDTTRPVTPIWTSSNSDVASVDAAGRLDGRTHGVTTLTASHDGITATKSVLVVNNYRGSWVGRFIVNGCDAPPGVCAAWEFDVFSFPVSLLVSQTGADLSRVSASLSLPSYFQIRANLTGNVTSDGRLNLSGSSELLDRGDRLWATFHVGAWDTALSGGGAMTGRWAQRLTILQPPSNEITENELESMTRIPSVVGPVSPSPDATPRF